MQIFKRVLLFMVTANAFLINYSLFWTLGEASIADSNIAAIDLLQGSSYKAETSCVTFFRDFVNNIVNRSYQQKQSTRVKATIITVEELPANPDNVDPDTLEKGLKQKVVLWLDSRLTQDRISMWALNAYLCFLFTTCFSKKEGIVYRMFHAESDTRLACCQDAFFLAMAFFIPVFSMKISIICYFVMLGLFAGANITYWTRKHWIKWFLKRITTDDGIYEMESANPENRSALAN